MKARSLLWTYHANMRLRERFIERESILAAESQFVLIEGYPQDKYLPSYLVHGEDEQGAFHVLFALDVAGGNVRVVTAYRPDPEDWEPDLKTRRTP